MHDCHLCRVRLCGAASTEASERYKLKYSLRAKKKAFISYLEDLKNLNFILNID
jgi:hypothetical protein